MRTRTPRVRQGLGQVPQQAESLIRRMAGGDEISGLYIRKHCLHRYLSRYISHIMKKGFLEWNELDTHLLTRFPL